MDQELTSTLRQQVEQQESPGLRWISDRERMFWLLNAVGWAGISVVTYFSLSLPYSQFELSYLVHNVSQSLVGFLLTLPMRWGFKAIWDWPVGPRVAIALTLALVFAIIWAILRLLLFL
ncbi:MAG: histidine kinase, partial [Cellvibrionales bacterium]